MKDACFFCEHDCCDICSVGRAYDPELRQEDPFVEALLDALEEALLDALEEVNGDG